MGRKGWQDLACWFKNVWVGVERGESQYYFVFCFLICFFTFPAKVGKKKVHLNWCVLASLQPLGNGEASGLEAYGDPGLAPVPSIQSQGAAV